MPTTDDAVPTSPPTTPPSPPPPSSARRRAGGPILTAALGLLGLALAVVAWGGAPGSVVNGTTTIRPSSPVDRVVLAVEAGAIEVVSGDELVLRATRSGRDFVVEHELSDGILQVRVACSRLAQLRGCLTPVRLVVPPGVAVVASTQAGAIVASGLGTGADLRTEAGSIDVHDLAGPIHLRSEAGSLRGSVLTGTIEARTTTGAIALRVIEDARQLVATTEVGTIDLTVPDATYQVDVGTTLGGTDVGISHTPGAERTLAARSELGSVRIRLAGR